MLFKEKNIEYKPRVFIADEAEEIGRQAASHIAALLQEKPNAVLGMATGSTPEPMYKALVELHRQGLSFSRVVFFNLDEYVGLSPEHPQSYHAYMRQHFFNHIDAAAANIYIPNGVANNIEQECAAFEEAIYMRGGIDLQVLGIGLNGHIGFCEPGSSLAGRTHCVTLTSQTRSDNSRFFDCEDSVPKQAISMGLGTIMKANSLILLASSPAKRVALHACLNAPISSAVPATILRTHPQVTLYVTKDAYPLPKQNNFRPQTNSL